MRFLWSVLFVFVWFVWGIVGIMRGGMSSFYVFWNLNFSSLYYLLVHDDASISAPSKTRVLKSYLRTFFHLKCTRVSYSIIGIIFFPMLKCKHDIIIIVLFWADIIVLGDRRFCDLQEMIIFQNVAVWMLFCIRVFDFWGAKSPTRAPTLFAPLLPYGMKIRGNLN